MVKTENNYLYELQKYPDIMSRLSAWWHLLQGKTEEYEDKKTPSKSGIRAQLSRCSSPAEVVMYSEFYTFKEIFENTKYPTEAIAIIAGLFSIIRKDSGKQPCFIEQLATPKEGSDKPVFSEMRFRKLLDSKNWDEFYLNLRRAIQILGGNVNPISVADTILLWGWEFSKIEKGEYVKPGNTAKFKLAKMYYENIK